MADLSPDARLKSELIAQLDAARSGMRGISSALRKDTDIRSHVRQSVQIHKTAWITSAAFGVGVLALLGWARFGKKNKRRKKVVVKESKVEAAAKGGLLLASLKFVFSILQPTLTSLLKRAVADRFMPGMGGRWRY